MRKVYSVRCSTPKDVAYIGHVSDAVRLVYLSDDAYAVISKVAGVEIKDADKPEVKFVSVKAKKE